MSTLATVSQAPRSAAHLWFEKHLPELTSRCRTFVRRLPAGEREEATAEVLAQMFRYVLSAQARGKLHRLTMYTLVAFFFRSYCAGRRMAGSSSTDVLSEACRLRHRLRVVSLDQPGATDVNGRPIAIRLSEALTDPKADRPLENVRRDIDYPEILDRAGANRKVRRVFTFFCETAGAGKQVDLARELGVSSPRICQLKDELADILTAYGYQPPAARKSAKRSKKRGRPAGRGPRHLDGIPLNVGTPPGRR